MRRLPWVFLLAAGIGDIAQAAATEPVALLDICIERLSAADKAVPLEEPIEELPLLCPELEGLHRSLDRRLFAPLQEDLSLVELIDLRHALRSQEPVAQRHRLNHSGLREIIENTLRVEPEKTPGYWERFTRWLREKLTSGTGDGRWLDFFQGIRLPEWVATALLRGTILLIIVMALATVLNEFREVPWRWRGLRRRGRVAGPQEAASGKGAIPEEIASLPLRAQGAALFRRILAQLAARRLVREDPAHTHREYAVEIGAGLPAIATPIETLARAAERGIYGSTEPHPGEVERWHETARTIESTLAEERR